MVTDSYHSVTIALVSSVSLLLFVASLRVTCSLLELPSERRSLHRRAVVRGSLRARFRFLWECCLCRGRQEIRGRLEADRSCVWSRRSRSTFHTTRSIWRRGSPLSHWRLYESRSTRL